MPAPASQPELIISPHNERVIREYLRAGKPFFLEGGPGIGKSLAARKLAEEMFGPEKVAKIDITEDTEVRHLLGEYDLVSYFAVAQRAGATQPGLRRFFIDGKLTEAARNGWVLIIEELDRAGRETLFPVIFDALEYGEFFVPELGEMVRGQPGFNIVMTVNRFTDIGTVSLPKALLRRARCVRFYDPSKDLGINRTQAVEHETRIVMANLANCLASQPLRKKTARELVSELLTRVIFPLRAAGVLAEAPTPAETQMWFKDMCQCEGEDLLADGVERRKQLEICLRYRGALVKSADDDERFIEAIRSHFGREIRT